MSFAKQERKINQQSVFNPPPGYYEQSLYQEIKKAPTFGQQERFRNKTPSNIPGPGAYFNKQKEQVRKRLIDQSQKRDVGSSEANPANNIKISSIPSIPKKSATRVYEQLAPGILILHEQEYQNASIGPGSYNINNKLVQPKQIVHKIAPEHKKKVIDQQNVQINVPTVAEQIRNVRRMMYKQNLIKSSTVNKAEINPSDLCLEVIILRQKLLRSEENPPPGYYNNQNLSDFKSAENPKTENQFLGGRQKRFIESMPDIIEEVGPGSYKVDQNGPLKGGFIPKQVRKLHPPTQDKPGPGTYISQKQKPKGQMKGNYPPIFGSGCNRFPTAPKTILASAAPGPGSYQIDKKKNKKQKYMKIKKQLLQPTTAKSEIYATEPVLGIQSDMSHLANVMSAKQRKFYQYNKNTSNFASKVQRFQSNRTIQESIGPGNYQHQIPFYQKSFNKKAQSYIGGRVNRFDETELRPKIGPGTYNLGYETVKQKKIMNVFL